MLCCLLCLFFFFKQKTAYEMRISDWSSDVCSSDLLLSSEEDEDEAEDEGTTGFPFTLRRRGDPAEEWGLPGEANDPRRAPGSYFDGLDDRDGDHDEIGRASCRERECQYG